MINNKQYKTKTINNNDNGDIMSVDVLSESQYSELFLRLKYLIINGYSYGTLSLFREYEIKEAYDMIIYKKQNSQKTNPENELKLDFYDSGNINKKYYEYALENLLYDLINKMRFLNCICYEYTYEKTIDKTDFLINMDLIINEPHDLKKMYGLLNLWNYNTISQDGTKFKTDNTEKKYNTICNFILTMTHL